MVKAQASIFSNMFSLLNPFDHTHPWPLSLELPNLFEEQEEKKEGLERMFNSRCPHANRKHYAKNMCRPCYHLKGRSRKAWKCRHTESLVYARGLCNSCYMKNYYSKRLNRSAKRPYNRPPKSA
mmetsp:Transcript_29978/g.53185  ORF Transcript_29978/g.53185 Transcript_29978/m.53185 type:complete len:124 (-) Transcript_29978:58-429(-)